jgi:hypothetical protein
VTQTDATHADASALLTVEVRLDGALIRRVSADGADELVRRGWAEYRSTGRRRHVALLPGAPLSSYAGLRGRDGTRPVRADGTCKRYGHGQVIGHPVGNREFR